MTDRAKLTSRAELTNGKAIAERMAVDLSDIDFHVETDITELFFTNRGWPLEQARTHGPRAIERARALALARAL